MPRREPSFAGIDGLRDLTTRGPGIMSTSSPSTLRAFAPSSCPFASAEPGDFAYFENAGGSFTSADVLNRMRNFYWNNKVQPYEYRALGRAASKAMEGISIVALRRR